MARALLSPVADPTTLARIDRLLEQLDERRRAAEPKAGASLARDAVVATVSTSRQVDPTILRCILTACRRDVVHITYTKPRENERSRRMIEPWQVRWHDGLCYVRAYDRTAKGPRTFQVGQIAAATRVPAAGRPQARVPRPPAMWGDGDPRYGIDHDRPDTAVIVVAPPWSRWLAKVCWHPAEQDRKAARRSAGADDPVPLLPRDGPPAARASGCDRVDLAAHAARGGGAGGGDVRATRGGPQEIVRVTENRSP